MIHRDLASVRFKLDDRPIVPLPKRVLMTSPAHFDVLYVINPHMQGNVGDVDAVRAREQWVAVRDAFVACGLEMHELPGQTGLPDMVFCANQTLPAIRPMDGGRELILSRMYAEQRRGEVTHYDRFFREQGYEVHDDLVGGDTPFEGMGDAIWHADRFLLWGGYGFRTNPHAYEVISHHLGVPILLLYLDDPDFYHLDTCLCVLDADHAIIFPGAFDAVGLELLRHFFRVVIEAPEDEARHLFACNATCPDGHHVIIQEGCVETCRQLREHGFEPVEVDTGEFLKSGGSVYCMKQLFW